MNSMLNFDVCFVKLITTQIDIIIKYWIYFIVMPIYVFFRKI